MKYVPYYRVSTASQGKSGLGLSAQRDIVHRFVKREDELLTEFVEVESGKRADRPQLERAIALAKQQGARLLIARASELFLTWLKPARNVITITILNPL